MPLGELGKVCQPKLCGGEIKESAKGLRGGGMVRDGHVGLVTPVRSPEESNR